MYRAIYLLLAHGAAARPIGHGTGSHGLGPASEGGAGVGGGPEVGVLLLPDPVFSSLPPLLPRPRPRIAYFEPTTDAPAVLVQPSPAPEGLESNEAGADSWDDGSPRPSLGVGANSAAGFSPNGTSSSLPAITTVRGGGGGYPEDAGTASGGGGALGDGGAPGGQAPFPSLPELRFGDGGPDGLAPKDALPSGNGTGSPAIERLGSTPNVLVS